MYGVDGSHLRLQQPAVADSPQNLRPVHNRLFPMPTAAEANLYTCFQARSLLADPDKPKEPQAVFKPIFCKRKSPVLFDTETDVMRPTKFPRVDDGGQLVDVVRRYVHQFQDTNEQSTVNNNQRRGNLYSGTEVPLDPQMSRFAPFSSQLTSEQVTEMNWMQTQGINQMEVYRVDAVDGSNPFYNSHDTDNYSQHDHKETNAAMYADFSTDTIPFPSENSVELSNPSHENHDTHDYYPAIEPVDVDEQTYEYLLEEIRI
ncbi:uncharacterized protein A4U43_C07F27990 [Asparagus officinalis]|uniref:Uncharacterized protein n=1 Tax=Asparagus officinalis TaxID=4686 RepID=A0A5P1EFF6_ASPOF|nr:uncharacterized protein A4U43_C07F27990 [Asparagus officinalis]